MQTTLPNNDFRDILIKFDMMSETGEAPGLVFVREKSYDPSEIIALEYAKKYGANAVYFRRFDDLRPPIPQIYIYDFTEDEKDDFEIANLYKKLWNSGQVPFFFLFYKTEVKIFNCLKAPKSDRTTGKILSNPFETIILASRVQKELDKITDFSAKKFDNGTFWTNPKYKNKFKLTETAYLKLLKELTSNRLIEYLIGRFEKDKYNSCGGVERFKQGIHGRKLNCGAIIGYVQDYNFVHWHSQLNARIKELINKKIFSPVNWMPKDKLQKDYIKSTTAKFISVNSRQDDTITLFHLWARLN